MHKEKMIRYEEQIGMRPNEPTHILHKLCMKISAPFVSNLFSKHPVIEFERGKNFDDSSILPKSSLKHVRPAEKYDDPSILPSSSLKHVRLPEKNMTIPVKSTTISKNRQF